MSDWTPTSKKLPKAYKRVLVCDDDGELWFSNLFEDDDGQLKWNSDYWEPENIRIVAWMPLPKPYKED